MEYKFESWKKVPEPIYKRIHTSDCELLKEIDRTHRSPLFDTKEEAEEEARRLYPKVDDIRQHLECQ